MTNRDLSGLIWLCVLLSFILIRADLRRTFYVFIRALIRPKVLGSLVALAAYVTGAVVVGTRMHVWNSTLVAGTVIWFVGTGVVFFFKLDEIARPRFFRRTARSSLSAVAVIGVLVNLYAFSLPVELVLDPVVCLLAATSVVAGSRTELQPAKPLIDRTLGIAGLAFLAYSVIRLTTGWSASEAAGDARALALPVWLTVGVLPFVFVFGVWATYEVAFVHVDLATDDRDRRRAAKLALFSRLRFRTDRVTDFNGYWAGKLVSAPSLSSARLVVGEFTLSRERETQAAKDALDRLDRYAGAEGVDEDDRRLDQREFDATKAALQWIATAQMGGFDQHGHRYRSDLVERLAPFKDLPENHDIVLMVSADGQRWSAWRRTVTGWCLGIGSAGPPPNQWLYDSEEPPEGFPAPGTTWGEPWDAPNW